MVARHGITRGEEDKWRRITKLLALLTPASATGARRRAGRKFGAVLADGGAETARLDKPALSEQRLARLLAARGPGRHRARHPRPGPPATCIDAPSWAWAVLREDGRDLARDYYTRLDRRSEQKPEDTDD